MEINKTVQKIKKLKQWKIFTVDQTQRYQNFSFCYRYGRKIRLQGLQETLCVCQVGKSLLCHC